MNQCSQWCTVKHTHTEQLENVVINSQSELIQIPILISDEASYIGDVDVVHVGNNRRAMAHTQNYWRLHSAHLARDVHWFKSSSHIVFM